MHFLPGLRRRRACWHLPRLRRQFRAPTGATRRPARSLPALDRAQGSAGFMIPPRILIIAGSDSGGGAGIQADIKAVTMFGGFAMTAITAITAQNTLGVEEVMSVPVDLVLKQIEAVLADLGADSVKIGMIGSAETAEAVATGLQGLAVPIVFDPVMVASSGATLADQATINAFERLMRLATVSTPNLPELGALTGREIGDLESLEDAALALVRDTGKAIFAKGGHLDS